MTAAEMLSLFDTLQEKNSEPYFTDAEKYQYLNAAQMDLFVSLFGGNDTGMPVMGQIDERATRLLMPFIHPTADFADSSGLLSFSNIKTNTGVSEDIAGVLDVQLKDGSDYWSAQFRTQQEFQRSSNNSFLTPSAANDSAMYTYESSGSSTVVKVSPSGSTWRVFAIKYPKDIAAGVNSEFPEEAHHKIVAIALEKAGITTEADALPLINQVTS